MSGIDALASAEVVARHDFFVAWFTGNADAAAMEEAARAFAPDMRRIGPEGRVQDAGEVIAMLRAGRATRAEGFAIRVEVREARALGGGLALVIYDEHQADGAARTARRASALFGVDAAAPGGVAWRHLQETWIDPPNDPDPGAAPGRPTPATPQAAPRRPPQHGEPP